MYTVENCKNGLVLRYILSLYFSENCGEKRKSAMHAISHLWKSLYINPAVNYQEIESVWNNPYVCRVLHNFYAIFHCGLYSKAANITNNLCNKQGNSSKKSAVYNQERFQIKSGFIMSHVQYLTFFDNLNSERISTRCNVCVLLVGTSPWWIDFLPRAIFSREKT